MGRHDGAGPSDVLKGKSKYGLTNPGSEVKVNLGFEADR
jgi:hypothetical protein